MLDGVDSYGAVVTSWVRTCVACFLFNANHTEESFLVLLFERAFTLGTKDADHLHYITVATVAKNVPIAAHYVIVFTIRIPADSTSEFFVCRMVTVPLASTSVGHPRTWS
jgi:hypothetical protein